MIELIMGVLFLVLTFGPVLYFTWLGKNRVKKVRKALKAIGEKSNLSFSQKEVWDDKALGLDQVRKVLLFLNHQQGAEARTLIDLTKAINCQVVKSTETILLCIGLRKENRLSETTISLFDSKYDDPVESGYHYLIAKKWAKFIEDLIRSSDLRPLKVA